MKCEFCDTLSFLKSLQRPERKDGISYTYKYSVAIIDECLANGKMRARGTNYIWNNVDDFPVVARRHIPYGHKEWVWDCKWGSGFTVSQSKGKNYLWKGIVLPNLINDKEC